MYGLVKTACFDAFVSAFHSDHVIILLLIILSPGGKTGLRFCVVDPTLDHVNPSIHIYRHFSDPGRAVGRVCVCLCACMLGQ